MAPASSSCLLVIVRVHPASRQHLERRHRVRSRHSLRARIRRTCAMHSFCACFHERALLSCGKPVAALHARAGVASLPCSDELGCPVRVQVPLASMTRIECRAPSLRSRHHVEATRARVGRFSSATPSRRDVAPSHALDELHALLEARRANVLRPRLDIDTGIDETNRETVCSVWSKRDLGLHCDARAGARFVDRTHVGRTHEHRRLLAGLVAHRAVPSSRIASTVPRATRHCPPTRTATMSPFAM